MVLDIIFVILILLFGNASLWAGFFPSLMTFIGAIVSVNIVTYNILELTFIPTTILNIEFYKFFEALLERIHISQAVYYFSLVLVMRFVFYWIGKNIGKLFSVMPFWKLWNKALGFILGVIKGVICSVLIAIFMKYFDFYYDAVESSIVIHGFEYYMNLFYPFCNQVLSGFF
jgi:uncharacterized membrane protein required for colicin V production